MRTTYIIWPFRDETVKKKEPVTEVSTEAQDVHIDREQDHRISLHELINHKGGGRARVS